MKKFPIEQFPHCGSDQRQKCLALEQSNLGLSFRENPALCPNCPNRGKELPPIDPEVLRRIQQQQADCGRGCG